MSVQLLKETTVVNGVLTRRVGCSCVCTCTDKPQERTVSPALSAALNATGITAAGLAAMLGSAQARASGLNPLGSLVIAGICGVGGGTIRDILHGKRAFWIDAPGWLWYTTACGLAGLHSGVVSRVLGSSGKAVDAVFTAALGGCALAGATVASDPMAAGFFALLSAAGGGVVRDVLLQRRPTAFYADGLASTAPAAVGAMVVALAASKKCGGGCCWSPNMRMAAAVAVAVGVNRLMVSQLPAVVDARKRIASIWCAHKSHATTATASVAVTATKDDQQKKK